MRYENGARDNVDMTMFKPELLQALQFMEEGVYWEIGYSADYQVFDDFIQDCRDIIENVTRPRAIHARISLAIDDLISTYECDYNCLNDVYPYFEADIATLKYILDKYVDVTDDMTALMKEFDI